jgi:hypothetical protein
LAQINFYQFVLHGMLADGDYLPLQDAESFCFGTYTQDGVAQVTPLLYKME